MSVSAAKRRVNRANAQKSTGPRTEQGKARSSQNSTTHGLFCKDLVLAKEDEKVFHFIREEFIDTLAPQNLLELSIVDRIVSASWKLRRLAEAESDEHDRQTFGTQEDARQQASTIAERFGGTQGLDRARVQQPDHPHIRLYEQAATLIDYQPPAATTLLRGFAETRDVLERFARYEQQLERSIQRHLRDLRELRKMAGHIVKLPASPYRGTIMEELAQEAAEQELNLEQKPTKAAEQEQALNRQIVEDATEPAVASVDVAESCEMSQSVIAPQNGENEATAPVNEAQLPLQQEIMSKQEVELVTPATLSQATSRDARSGKRGSTC